MIRRLRLRAMVLVGVMVVMALAPPGPVSGAAAQSPHQTAESVTVTLSSTEPGYGYANPGDETAYRVTLQSSLGENKSFDIAVSIEDTDVGEVSSVEFSPFVTDGEVERTDQGVRLTGEASGSGTYLTLAIVRVEGKQLGRSAVTLSDISVSDEDGDPYEISGQSERRDSLQVTNNPITALSWESTREGDTDTVAQVGSTMNFTLYAQDAEAGVGSYNLTFILNEYLGDEAADARIVDIEPARFRRINDPTISDDGQRAQLSTISDGPSGTGAIPIATVEVKFTSPGESQLSLEWPYTIESENGSEYDIPILTVKSATVRPAPNPVGDFENEPRDPDEDGLYEDVNGDGSVDVADVQTLFAHRDTDAIRNYTWAFDFNRDGSFGIADIEALFEQVTEDES